jgi:hypothetical protein
MSEPDKDMEVEDRYVCSFTGIGSVCRFSFYGLFNDAVNNYTEPKGRTIGNYTASNGRMTGE